MSVAAGARTPQILRQKQFWVRWGRGQACPALLGQPRAQTEAEGVALGGVIPSFNTQRFKEENSKILSQNHFELSQCPFSAKPPA